MKIQKFLWTFCENQIFFVTFFDILLILSEKLKFFFTFCEN